MEQHQRTILVCQDSESLNSTIREHLLAQDHRVCTTTSGESAWQIIEGDDPPGVLICDNELPGLCGLDLLALVKAAGLSLPVIFMTGAGTERVAAEALNLGASSYLIKGEPGETLRCIDRALEKILYQLDLETRNRELVQKLQHQNDELEKLVEARTHDLQRALDDLQSLDRLKSDFMTLISHEMRTPVASILGFSDILRQGLYQDAEELNEIHGHLYQAGARLSEFISDSIELFQWLSGTRPLTIDTVNLAELVTHSIEAPLARARKKQLDVRIDIPAYLSVEADRNALQQAVLRVFDNCVKYSHAGGTVHIRGERSGDQGSLCFTDEGVGIHPGRVASVFRPLEVCGDLAHHHEGQGLSLPLVKEALEAHGGEVSVTSDGPGRGACVLLRLPLCHVPAASRARSLYENPIVARVLDSAG